jgi:hypothetical protein
MSPEAIKPDEIPGADLDPDAIEAHTKKITAIAGSLRNGSADVNTDWTAIAASYSAPEAETLLGLMKPVSLTGDAVATNLESLAAALNGFATEIRPIKTALAGIKTRAQTFVTTTVAQGVGSDHTAWHEDQGAVDTNNGLIAEVNDQVEALMAAERTCANKIRALYGAAALHTMQSADDPLGYGVDDLSGADVPWGTAVDRTENCGESTARVVFKEFLWDGICVNGAWGAVQGLGTLAFGYNPTDNSWWKGETYGQAWSQVGYLAAGIVMYTTPITSAAKLGNDLLRANGGSGFLPDAVVDFDSQVDNTMLNAGKGLIAWDKWADDPATAAGESLFNVGTLLIPGGGEAVAGIKGGSTAARIATTASRVVEFADAGAWATKALSAGAGISVRGLSDVLKNMNLSHFDNTIPDVHLGDLPHARTDFDGASVRTTAEGVGVKVGDYDIPVPKEDVPAVADSAAHPGNQTPESQAPPQSDTGTHAGDSPASHSDAPSTKHPDDAPAQDPDPHRPDADGDAQPGQNDATPPHEADASEGQAPHQSDSDTHAGDAEAPHSETPPHDHDAADAVPAKQPDDPNQVADPDRPGYDTDGHPIVDDRGDGKLHYQLDPPDTFRDINNRLHDAAHFATDPYTGLRYDFTETADLSAWTPHDMSHTPDWKTTVAERNAIADDARAAYKSQCDAAEQLGIDPTGKSPRQITKETADLAKTNPRFLDEADHIKKLGMDTQQLRKDLNLSSENLGDIAGSDVAASQGGTMLISGSAGANRLDQLWMSQGSDGFALHVNEVKGGNSPSLGGRQTVESGYAQQGTPGYLADLLSGRNTDPRLNALVSKWQTDPKYADLVAQLKGDGVPVSYELINARTSGGVRVSQFNLGGDFRLRLGENGLEVLRQGA